MKSISIGIIIGIVLTQIFNVVRENLNDYRHVPDKQLIVYDIVNNMIQTSICDGNIIEVELTHSNNTNIHFKCEALYDVRVVYDCGAGAVETSFLLGLTGSVWVSPSIEGINNYKKINSENIIVDKNYGL